MLFNVPAAQRHSSTTHRDRRKRCRTTAV